MALKACPHCDRFFNPGAVWAAHEKKCAREHEKTSVSTKLARLKAKQAEMQTIDHSDDTCLLWNRGQWRGWAVGRVTDRNPFITSIETTHFKHTLMWDTSELMKDILDGRVFFIDPVIILRMVADQVSVIEDTESPLTDRAAELIEEAAELLLLYKRTREDEVSADLADAARILKAEKAEEKDD